MRRIIAIARFSIVSLSIVSVFGCKPQAQSASQAKWGWLSSSDAYWLVNKANGSSVSICGANADVVASAVEEWAGHIDRSFTYPGCTKNPDIYSYSHKDAKKRGWCDKIKTGFASPTRFPQRIVDCGNYGKNGRPFYLHEVGHLYGLCDQYAKAIGNCAKTTKPVKGSLMSGSYNQTIKQDDIDGIRAIAGLDVKKPERDEVAEGGAGGAGAAGDAGDAGYGLPSADEGGEDVMWDDYSAVGDQSPPAADDESPSTQTMEQETGKPTEQETQQVEQGTQAGQGSQSTEQNVDWQDSVWW